MSHRENTDAIATFEGLISRLEYVEGSELVSDIRENTYAELKRIRRNISLVLLFLDRSVLPPRGKVRAAAEVARRECLLTNRLVGELLLLHQVRIPQRAFSRQLFQLRIRYCDLGQSCCRLCLIAAPQHAYRLAEAFQMGE